jgi:hypothetical protein
MQCLVATKLKSISSVRVSEGDSSCWVGAWLMVLWVPSVACSKLIYGWKKT